MTREIKFRAWDKKNNKWSKIEEWGVAGVNATIFDDRVIPNLELHSDDFYEWSQFTGLLDKNGKEIYEGDILRWNDSRNLEVRWGNVGWDLWGDLFKSFGQPEIGNCTEYHTKSYCIKSEIIGNIYENPELIK